MKLDELVLLQQILEKEISMAKERTVYFEKILAAKEKQMDDSGDEEEIELIHEELKSIRSELKEARKYERKLSNIEKEISEREFSII